MTDISNSARPHYPCAAIPAEAPQARLLGLYPQRQEGLLMQRLKITGGRLTLAQWRRTAEAALRLTPGGALHLTTRQDLELHGLKPEDVPALQRELAGAGIDTVGACGDTVRAVTVDPASGLEGGSYDVGPLAVAIHAHLQGLPGSFALPRKFKVSVSGSADAGARPFINDVGLVAREDGALRVIVAGSLGARPNPGIVAYERIEFREALALVTAAERLFAAEGDRTNRSRARLRHVRERLGDVEFLARLDVLFREEKAVAHAVVAAPRRRPAPSRVLLRLAIPNGDLDPRDTLALVEAAQARRGVLRIGLEHDLYVYGLTVEELPETLRAMVGGAPVIACPGAHHCSRGITETWGAAEQLRAAIPAGEGLLVAVSGCPNGCSHPAVADLGWVGRLKTVDGVQRPHYRLLAGGGRGQSPELAVELHSAVPLERVGAVAGWMVQSWRAGRTAGETFGGFVRRERERLSEELKAVV